MPVVNSVLRDLGWKAWKTSRKDDYHKKESHKENGQTRKEELERENELLRLENPYLIKVESFSRGSESISRKAQTALAFELKEEFRLKDVLIQVDLPESIYYYHVIRLKNEDPDQTLKKDIQRLTNELGLKSEKSTRKSRYKSYKGITGKIAENRLNRRFDTSVHLQKLITDVTEFKCTCEKLYFSLIMDLSNGEVISSSISKRPTFNFMPESLDKAIPIIKKDAPYGTILHSN